MRPKIINTVFVISCVAVLAVIWIRLGLPPFPKPKLLGYIPVLTFSLDRSLFSEPPQIIKVIELPMISGDLPSELTFPIPETAIDVELSLPEGQEFVPVIQRSVTFKPVYQ